MEETAMNRMAESFVGQRSQTGGAASPGADLDATLMPKNWLRKYFFVFFAPGRVTFRPRNSLHGYSGSPCTWP